MLKFVEDLLQGAPVEWKTLGEIAVFYGGLTGKNRHDFEKGGATYIPYKNIFDNLAVDPERLEKVYISAEEHQNEVRYGDILFTLSSETPDEVGISSVVTVNFSDPVYLNSFSFGMRFNEGVKVLPDFAKHLFRSSLVRSQIVRTANGVTRFNISKTLFKNISIPLPPLHVQEKIVDILDKFTELEAELEARAKQYEYYRNKLLTFGEEVEWKTLGEIGVFVRGNGLQKKGFTSNGIGCIHYGQIYTHYDMYAEETISYVSDEAARKFKKAQRGDLIIAVTSENLRDVCKTVVWGGENEICVSGETYIFKHKQNAKYLAYHLQTPMFYDYKREHVTGTKVIRIHERELAKFLIPLPPLHVQEKIVEILDKFNTLTNSLTEGLPREIALRHKQYEYYRDQLLAFPRPQ